MLQRAYGNGPTTRYPPLENIEKSIELLDSVLANFTTKKNEQRRSNLVEIFKSAASFGFVLFSQMSTFKFDWKLDRTREPHSIVFWPALVQSVDTRGNELRPRRVIENPSVLRIA